MRFKALLNVILNALLKLFFQALLKMRERSE